MCQEKNADIFQCANRIYQKHPKKWKDFVAKYGDEYIKHIDIEVAVKMNNQI